METENFHSQAVKANPRAAAFFRKQQHSIYKSTDRLFAFLMPLQWLAGIIIASFSAPLTWNGSTSTINPHLWAAILIGGAIISLPVFLSLKYPGAGLTRYSIAFSQMLISSLLIHITGGRLETHFHIFGSLAFLAFYRDWRVLIPATIVATTDHVLRGWYFPESIYGIAMNSDWRWLEHAAWIIFEDVFLIVLCHRSVTEMWKIAVHTTALDDSEARYRTVVEQISEGVFLLEPETFNVIECNEAFAHLIGYDSVDEVKDLNAADFDESKEGQIDMMTRAVRSEKRSLTTERKYKRKDGSYIYVEITGRCITYNENIAYCVNARDITERKRIESEIKRLALVAQKTQNGVIITDTKGQIEWVNEGFTKITGYDFAEAVGQNPGRLLQGEKTSVETVLAVREALQQRDPYDGEIFNYRKDGAGYWVSISIMPIYSERGAHRGFIAIEMDITERKEMEKALREANSEMEARVNQRTAVLLNTNSSMLDVVAERMFAEQELTDAKQLLDKVVANIPISIFVKDKQGKYVFANRAFAGLYGVEPQGLIGKTSLDFARNDEEAQQYQNDDQEVLTSSREKFIFEERFTDANGNIRWLQTVKRPIMGESGVENILGIVTDLTERKILESQLCHAQKLQSIGQMAAGIAHEINTPAQFVSDNTRFVRDAFADVKRALEQYEKLLEALRTNSLTPKLIKEITEEIESADLEYLTQEIPTAICQSLDGVNRIGKIVRSMKEFAQPGNIEKRAADLNKAIESTLTVARNEWKNVAEVETNFDPKLPPVPCLLGEFNQVVLNMVINASHTISDVVGDGSRGKGKITVTTTKVDNDWAEIRIADTGTGIPSEVRGKVFDPFFTTKQAGKGTGQGLAISHTVIVEKHKGKLSFETENGKGTTFIIQLPLSGCEGPGIIQRAA